MRFDHLGDDLLDPSAHGTLPRQERLGHAAVAHGLRLDLADEIGLELLTERGTDDVPHHAHRVTRSLVGYLAHTVGDFGHLLFGQLHDEREEQLILRFEVRVECTAREPGTLAHHLDRRGIHTDFGEHLMCRVEQPRARLLATPGGRFGGHVGHARGSSLPVDHCGPIFTPSPQDCVEDQT